MYQHYEYNKRGLLSAVYLSTNGTKPSTPEVSYTYTATGAVEQMDFKGDKDVAYGYTIRDWVESINNIGSADTEGTFAALYEYTDNGNVKDAQYHNPQVQTGGGPATHQWAFTYDKLNRLLDANFEGSSTKFDVSGLSYDAAGNIDTLRRKDETGSFIDDLAYTYQPGTNKLSSLADAVSTTTETWDAESASFSYDANGNLTSQSGKFTSIAYDHRNLPTHFDLDGGTDVRAFYNADGQRVLKEQSASSYRFYVMDGQQSLAVIKDGTLSHMNLVGNATFGRLDADGSGNITTSSSRRYYLTDHLGSTRAVTDQNGTILETFDYYPFGLLMPQRSTTAGNTIEKFTGKERDEAIGLDYFSARYYDPAVPRFTSVDLLADQFPSWTPYHYVHNNPLNLIDPTGESGEAVIDEDEKTVTVNSHLIFYGDASSEKLGQAIIDEINNLWNGANGTTEIDGETYSVSFNITFETVTKEEAVELAENNTDIKNNFIRLGSTNQGNRSNMQLGGNAGSWVTSDNLGSSTTAAHEYGHGLGLLHSRGDQRGRGQPDIMAARGTLVDPRYQYDPKIKAGERGGTVNPALRKVLQRNISAVTRGLVFNKNGKAKIGRLTNKIY